MNRNPRYHPRKYGASLFAALLALQIAIEPVWSSTASFSVPPVKTSQAVLWREQALVAAMGWMRTSLNRRFTARVRREARRSRVPEMVPVAGRSLFRLAGVQAPSQKAMDRMMAILENPLLWFMPKPVLLSWHLVRNASIDKRRAAGINRVRIAGASGASVGILLYAFLNTGDPSALHLLLAAFVSALAASSIPHWRQQSTAAPLSLAQTLTPASGFAMILEHLSSVTQNRMSYAQFSARLASFQSLDLFNVNREAILQKMSRHFALRISLVDPGDSRDRFLKLLVDRYLAVSRDPKRTLAFIFGTLKPLIDEDPAPGRNKRVLNELLGLVAERSASRADALTSIQDVLQRAEYEAHGTSMELTRAALAALEKWSGADQERQRAAFQFVMSELYPRVASMPRGTRDQPAAALASTVSSLAKGWPDRSHALHFMQDRLWPLMIESSKGDAAWRRVAFAEALGELYETAGDKTPATRFLFETVLPWAYAGTKNANGVTSRVAPVIAQLGLARGRKDLPSLAGVLLEPLYYADKMSGPARRAVMADIGRVLSAVSDGRLGDALALLSDEWFQKAHARFHPEAQKRSRIEFDEARLELAAQTKTLAEFRKFRLELMRERRPVIGADGVNALRLRASILEIPVIARQAGVRLKDIDQRILSPIRQWPKEHDRETYLLQAYAAVLESIAANAAQTKSAEELSRFIVLMSKDFEGRRDVAKLLGHVGETVVALAAAGQDRPALKRMLFSTYWPLLKGLYARFDTYERRESIEGFSKALAALTRTKAEADETKDFLDREVLPLFATSGALSEVAEKDRNEETSGQDEILDRLSMETALYSYEDPGTMLSRWESLLRSHLGGLDQSHQLRLIHRFNNAVAERFKNEEDTEGAIAALLTFPLPPQAAGEIDLDVIREGHLRTLAGLARTAKQREAVVDVIRTVSAELRESMVGSRQNDFTRHVTNLVEGFANVVAPFAQSGERRVAGEALIDAAFPLGLEAGLRLSVSPDDFFADFERALRRLGLTSEMVAPYLLKRFPVMLQETIGASTIAAGNGTSQEQWTSAVLDFVAKSGITVHADVPLEQHPGVAPLLQELVSKGAVGLEGRRDAYIREARKGARANWNTLFGLHPLHRSDVETDEGRTTLAWFLMQWSEFAKGAGLKTMLPVAEWVLPYLKRSALTERAYSDGLSILLSIAETTGKFGTSDQIEWLENVLLSAFHAAPNTPEGIQLRQYVLFAYGQMSVVTPAGKKRFEKFLESFVLGAEPMGWAGSVKRSVWQRATASERVSEMEARMPTLAQILNDPAKTARFLFVLGLLRQMYPFTMANRSDLPPLAYARESGTEFQIAEFKVAPLTESFRRHVVYVGDPEAGGYAVELKVPGERSDKRIIDANHFEVAEALVEESPHDPKTPLPILFWRPRGHYFMYGDSLLNDTVGIMVFDYKDGKRNMNITPRYLKYVSQRTGIPVDELQRRNQIETAMWVIQLHRRGYFITLTDASGAISDTDAHDENGKLCVDGTTMSVADFGAAAKAVELPLWRRQAEVRTTVFGLTANSGSRLKESLIPDLVEKLVRSKPSVSERADIAAQTIEELGWDEQHPALMQYLRRVAAAETAPAPELTFFERRIVDLVVSESVANGSLAPGSQPATIKQAAAALAAAFVIVGVTLLALSDTSAGLLAIRAGGDAFQQAGAGGLTAFLILSAAASQLLSARPFQRRRPDARLRQIAA